MSTTPAPIHYIVSLTNGRKVKGEVIGSAPRGEGGRSRELLVIREDGAVVAVHVNDIGRVTGIS